MNLEKLVIKANSFILKNHLRKKLKNKKNENNKCVDSFKKEFTKASKTKTIIKEKQESIAQELSESLIEKECEGILTKMSGEELGENEKNFDFQTCQRILEKLKFFNFQIENFTCSFFKNKLEDKHKIDYFKETIPETFSIGKNIWLAKVPGLNRGIGIEIFYTLDQLKEIIKNMQRGYQEEIVEKNSKISRSKTIIKSERFVIQKYIEKPLLFLQKKMDIRVWVLINQEMKMFVFKECYFRLSSENYNFSNMKEKFVHLTNNALQKYSTNFDPDETIKSIDQFDEYINQNVDPNYQFKRDTFPKIKDQIKTIGRIASSKALSNNKNFTFEIFGADFMIDIDFGVWFLEVNSNPSMSTTTELLKIYVLRMLDDTMKLTIDKIFKPPENPIQTETFPVRGYADDENLWEYLQI